MHLDFSDGKRNECLDCGWVYYQNPVAAVVAVMMFKQQLLLLRRAVDPGRGLLDLPGGFVEFGETAEEALRRELKEELMIESVDLSYFTSAPNHYHYLGVPYQTLDFFFLGKISQAPEEFDSGEILEICWRDPEKIDPNEVAFPSMYQIIQQYIGSYSSYSCSLSR